MSQSQPEALDAGEASFVRRIFVWSLALRVVVSLILHLSGYSSFLAPDEGTYAAQGRFIAQGWSGGTLGEARILATNQPKAYFYLNAVMFHFLGDSEIPIKLLNCIVGAAAGGYLYRIGRLVHGREVARLATLLFQFFPSLILWSALNVRDVWLVFLILLVGYRGVLLARSFSLLRAAELLLLIYSVTLFRPYLFVAVALPPLLALVVGDQTTHPLRRLVAFTVLSVGVIVLTDALEDERGRTISLEALAQARQASTEGESAVRTDVDISHPVEAVSWLPIGVAYFLLSPFPWQFTSPLKLLTIPEMLLLYWLTPSIARGLHHLLRRRLLDSLQPLLLTMLLTAAYALGEANVGTLYRHRAQVLGFYLLFAAVGMQRRPRRAGGPLEGLAEPSPQSHARF